MRISPCRRGGMNSPRLRIVEASTNQSAYRTRRGKSQRVTRDPNATKKGKGEKKKLIRGGECQKKKRFRSSEQQGKGISPPASMGIEAERGGTTERKTSGSYARMKGLLGNGGDGKRAKKNIPIKPKIEGIGRWKRPGGESKCLQEDRNRRVQV